MKVKRIIENYSDFLAAMEAKKSEDAVTRNEGKNALGNLRIRNPKLFDEYKARYEGIAPAEPTIESKPKKARKTAYDKEKYIREHPEINVMELRKKARERLLKGSYNLGLLIDTPPWMSKEDLLDSLNRLTISDLITASGKPVQRQTLLRKCINIAIAEGRIDEKKLRDIVFSSFCNNYKNKGIIILKSPDLYEPVKRVLREETTVEELLSVSNGYGVDIGKLVELINSKP